MKTLSQIPRNFSTKFCWQRSGPSESFDNNELPVTPLKPKEIKRIPIAVDETILTQLEKQENKENERNQKKLQEELQELFAKSNISGLPEAEHKDPEVSFALKADNPEFNYNKAIQETNTLLANLDQEMNGGSFDSPYQNIG